MRTAPDLARHVRDALTGGTSTDTIRAELGSAGWTETEIEAALAEWAVLDGGRVVPRPSRSRAAWDALFYALLFVTFGMVLGNLLSLAFGQINLRLPEPRDTYNTDILRGQRWSMAALIVFVPAFWWLNRRDTRAMMQDKARRHNTVRRWLATVAMFLATCALLGDALFLVYALLDGTTSARFFAKSATVALAALIALQYFRQDRKSAPRAGFEPAAASLVGVSALLLVLSFMTIGGPLQGRLEQRDRWRVADLHSLLSDMRNCTALQTGALPQDFVPTDCSRDPGRLTGYATGITYERLAGNKFRLCIVVEDPDRVRSHDLVENDRVCAESEINYR